MLQSIIIYSCLLSIMIIFGVVASISEHNRNLSNFSGTKHLSFLRFEIMLPILLFTFVFAIRYDVGVDYLSYLEIYKFQVIPEKIEPLFRTLIIFCKSQNFHFTIFFGLIAFIEVFFFYYSFRDQRFLFPFLTFALFTNGDWLFWMNGMRQAMAMCIWIFSIQFITNKKVVLYIFWGIIACLFHRSAIILFVFYPILRNGKDYFNKISLQLMLIGCAFGIRSIFDSLLSSLNSLVNFYISLLGKGLYQNAYNLENLTSVYAVKQDGSGIAFIFRIIVNIIIVLYSRKLKKYYNSKHFTIFYFFYFIGLICIYIFPAGLIAFTRPFRYFTFFPCIMLAYFLYYLYKNKEDKVNLIIYRCLVILFILVFYLGLYVADADSHIWYQFFFQVY